MSPVSPQMNDTAMDSDSVVVRCIASDVFCGRVSFAYAK